MGTEKKQMTAVEWLYEELWKQTDFSLPNNIFNQAKQIEKEQIIDAFQDSRILSITNNCSNGEQYYNETFKND
jgi:hypothetical protein